MDLADLVFLDLEGPQPEPEVWEPCTPLAQRVATDAKIGPPQRVAQTKASAEPQRVAIVLDHHHLEVAAKQRALATHWDPVALISAIQDQLSTALAAEDPDGQPPLLEVVQCHAADSLLGQQAKLSAKGRLHTRLKDAGFTMHCSPNKSSKPRADGSRAAGGQGATDVDVVVILFDLAGAFADTRTRDASGDRCDHIVLVGGDSDFRPALEYLIRRGPPALRIWVVADARSSDGRNDNTMQSRYCQWLSSEPRAGILSLPKVLEALARDSGKTVLLYHHILPSGVQASQLDPGHIPHVVSVLEAALADQTSRAVTRIEQALQEHAGDAEALSLATEAAVGDLGEVVLNMSNNDGFGDAEVLALAAGIAEMLERRPQLRGAMAELWLHHTSVGCSGNGVGATALASILIAAPAVKALHLSHCPLDMNALEAVAAAVASSFEAGLRKDKLYLNIVELGNGTDRQPGPVSESCLAQFAERHKQTLSVKYQNQRRASGSSVGGRGGGRGGSRGSPFRGRGRGAGRGRGGGGRRG